MLAENVLTSILCARGYEEMKKWGEERRLRVEGCGRSRARRAWARGYTRVCGWREAVGGVVTSSLPQSAEPGFPSTHLT